MEATEHHEHAEHAHQSGNKRVALLIAILAAILAFLDHGAKLSQTKAFDSAIAASDQWNFYQAKSLRMHVLKADADLIANLDELRDPKKAAARAELEKSWRADAQRYDSDPKSGEGRKEIQERAKVLEEERDHALHALHSYETGVSAIQLGIVLATASIIAEASWLLLLSGGLGLAGIAFGVLGFLASRAPI